MIHYGNDFLHIVINSLVRANDCKGRHSVLLEVCSACRSLTSNSEKYAADLSRLEANQASMKSHLHNVESRHTILMTESRARHNHTNPSSLATQADISRIVGEVDGPAMWFVLRSTL